LRRNITTLVVILALLIALILIVKGIRTAISPVNEHGDENYIYFRVNDGETTHSIAERLEREGLIKSDTAFITLARVTGADKRLQAGLYRLSPTMSSNEILDILTSGRIYTNRVTIPEGFTIEMIASRLEEAGIADKARFLELCNKPHLFEGIPNEAKTLEGYLFPDTYEFTPDTDEEEIIGSMITRYKVVYNELSADYDGDLSEHQIITLASIIEKETYLDEERPLVSSVFHNRLKNGMKLESCATILFIVNRPEGPIYLKDLKIDNHYNTYKYTGLPPGPICSPGRSSIMSAMYPAETDYLYFVSKGDGSHYFTETFREHERYRIKKERDK